jgi:hypothetical protein
MTSPKPAPRRHALLYAILGGIIAATIPFYCTAVILIALNPTPTAFSTPTRPTVAVPTRFIPHPATDTPPDSPSLTATPTHTQFTPPTPTVTLTPSMTEPPTQPPTRTRTPTPLPTNTPPPTATPTEIPTDTATP